MESFWFLLVLWTSCNELFNIFLVSGDVCDEGVFHSSMFKPAAFLAKLTSIKMFKSLGGVNAFVFFSTCSLRANPSCVPLGEMLDIDDLDPARPPQRKSINDYVDLVSRSHEAEDVWVRHNEAQDRTMSAMGKILLGIETEYKENELDKPKRTGHARACQQSCRNGNKNSNSNDVVNEVFLRRVNVPAVPLLNTSYLQLESCFKRSDVQFCVKECAKVVRDRMHRATGICRYLLCSSLLSVIVEIKSLLIAYGVPYGFLDFDRDSHSFEKNVNTLGKSKKLIRTSFWIALTLLPWATYDCVQGRFGASVFEKTFEPGSKSIIGLGPAKQATEKYRSDLLAVRERNVDLERFYPAEFAGVECRLLAIGLKRSVFKELHEDLEQSFCAEIALSRSISRLGRRPRVTRESCKPLNVWKCLRMKSLRLEKWKSG